MRTLRESAWLGVLEQTQMEKRMGFDCKQKLKRKQILLPYAGVLLNQ